MHSHNMAAVTLPQYKSKKDSTRQQLSHCVRICVSSFFRLRERCVIFSYARKVGHRIELEQRLVIIVQVQQDACRVWTASTDTEYSLSYVYC